MGTIYKNSINYSGNASSDNSELVARVTANETAIADRYTKTETNTLLDEKASFNVATISGGGGGDEISATVSQGTNNINVNYYKDNELPNSLNLSVDDDDFRIPTTGYVDTEVAKKGNAKITFDNEYQYLQIRDDNGTDIGFSQETTNTVRIQEYAKDSRGQVQNIFDETLASKTYVDSELAKKQEYVVIDIANFNLSKNEFEQLFYSDKLIYIKDGTLNHLVSDKHTWDLIPETVYDLSYTENGNLYTYEFWVSDDIYYQGRTVKPIGYNLAVGEERLIGTYRESGLNYNIYSKIIKIDALPAEAGITNYPHGITGIKQILQVYGFTTDGFVLNAPRQTTSDNIAIYQVQKSGNIAIEVGKDRSSKSAYVCLVYAKNN